MALGDVHIENFYAVVAIGPRLALFSLRDTRNPSGTIIMNISAIGGMNFGGFSMTSISFGGGAGMAGNMTAPTDGSTMTGGLPPQMQQLVELMQGMNSAQILMSLMLASGGKGDDDEKSNPMMAFMIGMMMGAHMNASQMPLNCQIDDAGNIGGMTGGNLNMLA